MSMIMFIIKSISPTGKTRTRPRAAGAGQDMGGFAEKQTEKNERREEEKRK